MPTYWTGKVPTQDSFGNPIKSEFVDGLTRMGHWAYMTPAAHRAFGVGLGTGRGQLYRKQADGRWLGTESPKPHSFFSKETDR